jgi:hypothetical protein
MNHKTSGCDGSPINISTLSQPATLMCSKCRATTKVGMDYFDQPDIEAPVPEEQVGEERKLSLQEKVNIWILAIAGALLIGIGGFMLGARFG